MESKLSAQRKQQILEQLEKERERRRSAISKGESFSLEGEDLSNTIQQRSERLEGYGKQRGQINALQQAKSQLQQQIKESKVLRTKVSGTPKPPKNPSPPQPAQTESSPPRVKPSKRKLPKSAKKPPIVRCPPEKLQLEAQKMHMQTCTFKPQITELPKGKPYNYRGILEEEDEDDRLDRLAQPKTQQWQLREEAKKTQEAIQLKECTFRPNITDFQVNLPDEPVQERLSKDAKTRSEKIAKLAQRAQDVQLANCTFQPKISKTDRAFSAAIHERIYQIQQERNEKLAQLQERYDHANKDLSFRPKLNANSLIIAQQKEGQGEILDEASQRIKESKKAQKLLQQEEQYTFHPQIRANTPTLNFYERQELFEEKKRVKQEELQSQKDQTYTFRPKLANKTQELVQFNPERRVETIDEKLRRLSTEDYLKKNKGMHQREQEYYSQFTFEPEINPISKALAPRHNLSDLAFNPNSKIEKMLLQEERARILEEECPFQPRINKDKHYKNAKSQYGDPQRILQEIQYNEIKKQQKAIALRNVQDEKVQQACTFQPEVKNFRKDEGGPVLIAGLSRHLELQQMARKKLEEKRQREHELFGIKNSDNIVTVPKPFNLSKGKRDERIETLKAEILQKEQEECTFKPETLESKNKALISRLLTSW